LGFFAYATEAAAAVTEPNGVVVPAPPYMTETTLQAFFDSLGETIDASADASIAPATFWPRCGTLEVRLLFSQSQAQCGLAWYNVPSNATSVPSAVYTLFPVGGLGTVSDIDIANDPNYAGGAIGFALLKNISGSGVVTLYYSEYQRNVFCSGCTAPDYWKMTLVYPSDIAAGAHYLAFEDWEGADATTWQGNDGDFNDKVFRVRGARPCNPTCPTDCGMAGAGGSGGGGSGAGSGGVGNGGVSGAGIVGGGRTGNGGAGGGSAGASVGGSDGEAGEDGGSGETSGGATGTGGRGGTANGGSGATDAGGPGAAGENGVGGEPGGGGRDDDDDDFDDDTNDEGGCGCSTVGASSGALGGYAVLALLVFGRRIRRRVKRQA
jgi:MYXO-CTERM domain-containing protein